MKRTMVFMAVSVVSGLALAFLLVAWRPQLIERAAPTAGPAPAAGLAPAAPFAQPAAAEPRPAAADPRSANVADPRGATPERAAESGPARVTYADAVERAAPAVVNIFTAGVVTYRIAPSGLDELFGNAYLPRYRSRIERSLGSGVIVDEQGHIVTNYHVIASADEIRVQLADGRIAPASVVGRDPDTDLAVLEIKLRNLPVMPLGRSDQLKVGDIVLAIGDPLGLSQTVTHGIVSATRRQQLGIATLEDFIQTDAPINVGNSGGALVDSNGELVGINTAIVAKNLGVEGIGFAIPVNMVRGVVSEIIAKGRVVRGWIGIVPEDVTNEQAAQLGLAKGGVVVATLYLGSPAVQAGLRSGDLVTSIGDVHISTAQELMAHIAALTPGELVRVRGLRGLSAFEVNVRVAEERQAGH